MIRSADSPVSWIIDEGAGSAILWLPGLQMTASAFAPLCKPLAQRHRVLVPEMPGYGASPRVDGPYDFRKVNQVLEAGLSARGVSELAGVVAFSAGAYRALLLALEGTIPIGRLALLGGTAGPAGEERTVFAQMAARYRSGPIGPELVAMVKEWGLSQGFRERHPERLVEIDSWLAAADHTVIADEMEAYSRAEDLLPRLGALRMPILARVGEVDLSCPPEKTRAIARAAKQTVVQVVPGAGHTLVLEDADGTRAALERFFAH